MSKLQIHVLQCVLLFFGTTYCVGKSIEISIYQKPLEYSNNPGEAISGSKPPPGPNPWNNETINLFKFMDAQYYGIIRIGNPSRPFKMVFDTTWADTWVPSAHCGLLELACMIHTRYDGSASSTYVEDGSVFQTGPTEQDLKGFVLKDSFNLAHMTIQNQTFVEMTHMPWLPWGMAKSDGIVGLAFPSLKRTNGPTFFSSMIQQNLIRDRMFVFYFNRDQTTERAGRLILGAPERKYLNGSLTTVPVIQKKYWKIQMDRMMVDKKNVSYPFCEHSCHAVFDTSANTITGPVAEVTEINNLLGARSFIPPIFHMDRYMVNCREYAKLPPIDFVIGGETFTIHSKYYVQHLVYESIEICLSPFVPANQSDWQLGGAFLMEFYTEYYYDTGIIKIGKTKF